MVASLNTRLADEKSQSLKRQARALNSFRRHTRSSPSKSVEYGASLIAGREERAHTPRQGVAHKKDTSELEGEAESRGFRTADEREENERFGGESETTKTRAQIEAEELEEALRKRTD